MYIYERVHTKRTRVSCDEVRGVERALELERFEERQKRERVARERGACVSRVVETSFEASDDRELARTRACPVAFQKTLSIVHIGPETVPYRCEQKPDKKGEIPPLERGRAAPRNLPRLAALRAPPSGAVKSRSDLSASQAASLSAKEKAPLFFEERASAQRLSTKAA